MLVLAKHDFEILYTFRVSATFIITFTTEGLFYDSCLSLLYF
jgi:hypothetical protein